MLSNTERQQLKQLVSSPQFRVVELLMQKMTQKWLDNHGGRETEWDTIKNTLIIDGKVRAMAELQQELMNQIQQHG